MNVSVRRGGRGCKTEVPLTALEGFHATYNVGGIEGRFFTHPRLAAYMSCEMIPEEARETFGHSCQHGPPPHKIRVIVRTSKRARKRRTYADVTRMALTVERLAHVLREERRVADAR
jgi:hypothetical protein